MVNIFFLIFIFGATIGSFLNVIILRYNTGQSVFFGRSKCFSCGKKLHWLELVPIFSFLARKGRCGNCKSKISWQYPIVEMIAGSSFLLIFLEVFNHSSAFNEFLIGSSLLVLYYWIIFSLLIIIAVYDYRHQIIPDFFVWVLNGLTFLSLFGLKLNTLPFLDAGKFISVDWSGLLAGIVLFAFFAFLWLISRGRWMGFGDAKLALGIGWFLGMEKGIAAIVMSYWIGAIAGVLLLWLAKRKYKKYNMKSSIAFGPFLAVGAAASFFYGEEIINFLLRKGSF